MNKVFDTGTCEKITISFDLSNNHGFIPLYTAVSLDLQNGSHPSEPIFVTPMHLTDASIPLTDAFKHNKGLLYYETYLSYKSLLDLPFKDIETRAKQLEFSYKIFDCNTVTKEFTKYDFGPYFIKSKELLSFVTLIDLI